MGLIYQDVRLSNAAKPDLEEINVRALVDSGANDLCIPKGVALQLKLEAIEQRVVTLADGRQETIDYVGPILVEVFGRRAFTGAMVLGETALLGAIPMEAMDVLIDPRRQQLIPNPEHPNIPGAVVMEHRVKHND